MGIFELQFYFGSLSINFQTYQDKNVCICMNLTNTITIIILLKEVLFVSFIENWCFCV